MGAFTPPGCTRGNEIAPSIKLSLVWIKISELAAELELFSPKPWLSGVQSASAEEVAQLRALCSCKGLSQVSL